VNHFPVSVESFQFYPLFNFTVDSADFTVVQLHGNLTPFLIACVQQNSMSSATALSDSVMPGTHCNT
jgi:hypothetical protein